MTNTEIEQVRGLLDRYILATYLADDKTLRACFHENAVMSGYLSGTLIVGDPEPFFEDISSMPSMESENIHYIGKIQSMSVTGSIAEAVIQETGFRGSTDLENHFHLIKDRGRWKIISKCFTTL